MKYPSKEQIVFLHQELIRTSGGLNGIRDEGCWIPPFCPLFKVLKAKIFIPALLIKRVA